MIFISAGLVVAALVLLIVGAVASTPILILGSIGASFLAAAFLSAGAYIRRNDLFGEREVRKPTLTLEEELALLAKTLQQQAQRLADVEAGVRARAAAAEKLQIEAKEHDKRAQESRAYADAQEKAAEAVEELLKSRTDAMAEFFTKRTNKAQIRFLVVGALLGGIVGVGLQELVNLL